MIEGLRRRRRPSWTLLQQRIDEHRESAARWSRAASGADDDADDAGESVQLPQHMCEFEAERLGWRVEVLEFLRDHLDPEELYLLGPADLEFGELLPPKPGSVEQQDYEERTAVGFHLGRLAKNVDRLGWSMDSRMALTEPPTRNDDPEFSVSRSTPTADQESS